MFNFPIIPNRRLAVIVLLINRRVLIRHIPRCVFLPLKETISTFWKQNAWLKVSWKKYQPHGHRIKGALRGETLTLLTIRNTGSTCLEFKSFGGGKKQQKRNNFTAFINMCCVNLVVRKLSNPLSLKNTGGRVHLGSEQLNNQDYHNRIQK